VIVGLSARLRAIQRENTRRHRRTTFETRTSLKHGEKEEAEE
jgi:hypothetical protein